MTTQLPPFTLDDLQLATPDTSLTLLDATTSFMNRDYLFQSVGLRHVVSIESLALLDERLPVVLDHLTSVHRRSGLHAREALAATLRYWAMPTPIVLATGTGNTPQAATYILDDIQHVDDKFTVDSMLRLYYTQSKLKVIAYVTFVVDIHAHWVEASHAWCEQHFPGSVLRLTTGFALGLTSTDLAKHGFYANDTVSRPARTLPDSLTELLP